METTKNEIPEEKKIFFEKLKNYLDTKIYFFGSIQREDYYHKSDIDIDIFTEKMTSTILKLQQFLKLDPSEFKKIIWRSNYDNTIVKGYKVMYESPENNMFIEISIYDEKYKDIVLKDHNGKKDIPFYATYSLIFIKFLFYTMEIMPKEMYKYLKKHILSTMIFKKETDFIVFK